jgi:hypothetical protein
MAPAATVTSTADVPLVVGMAATAAATAPPTQPLPTEALTEATPTVAIAAPAEDATSTDTPSPTPTLTLEPSATSVSPTPAPAIVRVLLNLVNLRRGPGVDYPLLGSVAGGEALEVLAWNNDEENPWFLIVTDDQRVGWISASVVQPDDAAALAGVPAAATLPAPPLPTVTPTPTATATPVVTLPVTLDPGDLDGTEPPPGTEPPDQPTEEPTEPSEEPTATPPPLGTATP